MIKENLQKDVIPLSRPLIISGETILDTSVKKLRLLVNKEIDGTITNEELKLKQWLSRLENVIRRDNTYSLSIDEAADIGLIQ